MVIGTSPLTQGVTTTLYRVGLVCDRGLEGVCRNDVTVAKDEFHLQ